MTPSETLSQSDIDTFRKDGILIIESGLPTSVLDGIVAELDSMSTRLLKKYQEGRIQDAWFCCPSVHRAAADAAILSKLAQLYGATARPFQTLNFPVGTQQRPHSDSIHFNSEPFGMMCGVWLALEDIGPDQGPLVYYPGSQRLEEFNFEDAGLPPNYEHYKQYEDYVESLIDKHDFKPSYGILKKGQAIIWAANVLHGGSKQNDLKLSRKSQVTHYYFENCQYWRPGHSRRKRAYFEPAWIPENVTDVPSNAQKQLLRVRNRLTRLLSE